MLSHAEQAPRRKPPSSVDPLTIHECAVRRPEVFNDHLAVDDAGKAVEARDAAVREDDVDLWISSRDHDTFREPDTSSSHAAVDCHERPRLVNGRHRLVERLTRERCSEFGPYSTASSIVRLPVGHVTAA
jgi:hypothetical protein